MTIRLIAFVVLLASTSHALAQDGALPGQFVAGEWAEFESELLGEVRRLVIGLPEGYETGDRRYPVLYVLDGPTHFLHTTGLLQFTARTGITPGVIVVAVANTDRSYDMSTTPRNGNPMGGKVGGADTFAAFFRDELIPHVNRTYRTSGHETLVGHSLGGLFVINTLIHHSETFDAYIAISPSLWWDRGILIEQTVERLKDEKPIDATLYMTMGDEGSLMVPWFRRLEAAFIADAPASLRWSSALLESESHQTTPYRSTLDGVEYVFRQWAVENRLELFDAGGMDAVREAYRASGEEFGVERTMTPMMALDIAVELVERGSIDAAEQIVDTTDGAPAAMFYTMIGSFRFNQGDHEVARRFLSKALTLDPGNDQIRKNLRQLGIDPDTVASRPTVDPARLAAVVGTFTNDTGEVMKIVLTDGRLGLIHPVHGGPLSAELIENRTVSVMNGLARADLEFDDDGRAIAFMFHAPDAAPSRYERSE